MYGGGTRHVSIRWNEDMVKAVTVLMCMVLTGAMACSQALGRSGNVLLHAFGPYMFFYCAPAHSTGGDSSPRNQDRNVRVVKDEEATLARRVRCSPGDVQVGGCEI